jgi:transglutaminase-like putative cysteine protease
MIKKIVLGCAVALIAVDSLYAQEEGSSDDAVRIVRIDAAYDINSDGTATIVVERAMSPLKQSAVNALGQQTVSFQDNMDEVEILEAYTLKQDGKRLDVTADRIVTQVLPAFASTPLYNDMKVKRIVFSDVAIGDQIVYRVKRRVVTPQIPGQFMSSLLFPRSGRFDDVRISLKHAKSFALQFSNRGLTELPARQKDGFVTHEWRYQNKETIPEEPGAVSPFDRDPQFEVSSFKSWAEVAKAYDARAKNKALVTSDIRTLADEITKDAIDKRAQAEAIYNWVAKNIRYVAIYLGAGGYVPHSSDAILANRYGDCKDHVAILEALLQAKGIDSEPVLISASNRFLLTPIPTMAFNHVITYLPEFKIYVDATARTLPFGMLAGSEAGKPVLHTHHFKDILYTPAIAPSEQTLVSTFTAAVADDGTLKGTTYSAATGPLRAGIQAIIDQLDRPVIVKQLATRLLTRDQVTGSGSLSKVDANDGSTQSSYRGELTSYRGELTAPNWINIPGPGATKLPSAMLSPASLLSLAINTLNSPPAHVDHVCPAVDIEETSTIQLPDKIKATNTPKNIEVSNSIANYRATYMIEGNTIKTVRKLQTKFPGPVCKPEQMAAFRDIVDQVRRDTAAQMTYE